MKEKYKWPVYGVLLGLVVSIISRYIMFKQAGFDISIGKMIGNPVSLWTQTLAPLVLGIVFFYIGVSRDRLIKLRKDTKEKNKELQKKMIEQSMQLGAELNRTIDELNRYTDQLDKIVNNIKAGVCVINRSFNIEEGFNKAFVDIFGNKDYLNSSILNTVFTMFDEEKKKEAADYFEQCFMNTTASNSILSAANPMEEFNYLFLDGGSAVSKIIKMRVVRLKGKDTIFEKILLLFYDITVEREMEKSIKEKEAEYDKKYGIIVSLLGNDREVTRQFITELGHNIKDLGLSLKELKQNEENTKILDGIIGMVHSIKGEAFSLDFKALAEEASGFETFLKEQKGQVLDLEMNLEIVNFYEKINIEYGFLNKIIKELTVFIFGEDKEPLERNNSGNMKHKIEENVRKHISRDEGKRSAALLEKQLQIIKNRTAEEKDKRVILDFNSDIVEMDTEIYKPLKEALLHLVRNSIDHGIEPAEERKKSGKPEQGTIKIMIKKADNGISVEYADDGKGFNVNRIKEKAVEKNIVNAGTVDKMSDLDIIKLVFKEGFSTNDAVDMISGMGVGMSVVKKNIIDTLKGKLSIKNKTERGIILKMSIPL